METDKILVKCPNCGAQGRGHRRMTEVAVTCPKCGIKDVFLKVSDNKNKNKPMTMSQKMPSGFGISSFNFGMLAILICWVPFVGVISLPLSIVGLILGIIGIVLSVKLKNTTLGFSITGTSLSVIAIIIMIITTSKATISLKSSLENIFGSSSDNSTISESLNINSDKEDIIWESALNEIVKDNVKIKITSCEIGKVSLKEIFGDMSISNDNLLMIQIRVTNLNPTNKLNYNTWAGETISLSDDYAILKDNYNNIYKRINFGYTSEIVGRTKNKSIYPNQSISDLLVFEKPIDSIQNLKLELPALNIDGLGKIYIEIPRSMINNL